MFGWLRGQLTSAKKGLQSQSSLTSDFSPIDLGQYQKYNTFRPGGKLPIFCYLPFNSMTFSMSGRVYVCSYNKNILLGTYPVQGIAEIWNGEEAQRLREHMRHNDLSYGCGHCKFYFDKGKFSNLRPPSFDKYSASTKADYPRVLEFELSNECNLECQMCNGNVSSSIRKRRDGLPPLYNPYDDNFLKQLEPYIRTLSEAKFYGGEPFLIPMYFRIWTLVAQMNPECELFVITNGMQWNARIEALIQNLNMDVAISIDSLQRDRLEKIRRNARFDLLMENIHRINAIMRAKGRYLSLSFTVQQENWDELPSFVRFCNSIEASVYISYLDNPKEYAISELPKEQLNLIHHQLLQENLSIETDLCRHNARCLADFIAYVNRYLTQENEPQYDDYHQSYTGKTVNGEDIIFVNAEASIDDLLRYFERYLAGSGGNSHLLAGELMARLTEVHSAIASHHHGLLRGMVLQSDITGTIKSLTEKTTEELRESILNDLHRIRLR